MSVVAISCSRCRCEIIIPSAGTSWCRCSKTFATRDGEAVGWGGPGTQVVRRVNDIDPKGDPDAE